MKTSADVTIWVGDDVVMTHTVVSGVHTITLSGEETSRIAVQFLDGFDGLVAFRDEISRVVGAWIPPSDEERLPPRNMTDPCSVCFDGQAEAYKHAFIQCPNCKKTWPF